MSIFEYRKQPGSAMPSRDSLVTLRETVERLEAEPVKTQRIVDLKRILAARIVELERRTG